MNNYEYCAFVARSIFPDRKNIRVLDYGCGAGHVVKLLLADGFDAWGCDVFYDGGNYSGQVVDGLLGSRVQRIVDNRIPYGDASFDLVISNQVLEHVADMDVVLGEMKRVLKPDGHTFHMFPDKSVWREGHCGIAFLHWFPKRNFKLRLAYAYLARSLGFGFHKKGKTRMTWARDFCDWLDKWTHYRPYRQIKSSFHRHFGPLAHREEEWIELRYPISKVFPKVIKILVSRKWGGLVFVSRKSAT